MRQHCWSFQNLSWGSLTFSMKWMVKNRHWLKWLCVQVDALFDAPKCSFLQIELIKLMNNFGRQQWTHPLFVGSCGLWKVPTQQWFFCSQQMESEQVPLCWHQVKEFSHGVTHFLHQMNINCLSQRLKCFQNWAGKDWCSLPTTKVDAEKAISVNQHFVHCCTAISTSKNEPGKCKINSFVVNTSESICSHIAKIVVSVGHSESWLNAGKFVLAMFGNAMVHLCVTLESMFGPMTCQDPLKVNFCIGSKQKGMIASVKSEAQMLKWQNICSLVLGECEMRKNAKGQDKKKCQFFSFTPLLMCSSIFVNNFVSISTQILSLLSLFWKQRKKTQRLSCIGNNEHFQFHIFWKKLTQSMHKSSHHRWANITQSAFSWHNNCSLHFLTFQADSDECQ